MSNLRKRTSRRKMSAPNMRRAIARIQEELFEMIAASPAPNPSSTMGSVLSLMQRVEKLWEKK